MLTEEQILSFHKNGYLVVPNMLGSEQIKSLQDFFYSLFSLPIEKRFPGDTDKVALDIFSRYPELRWLLFHEPSIKALKALLGDDYVVLREVSAHSNVYSDWHKDTTSQERAGHLFQWEQDYLMVEAAYYLQDNSEEFGGGLDVQPGSHLMPDLFVGETPVTSAEKPNLFKRASQKARRGIRGALSPVNGFLDAQLGINAKRMFSSGREKAPAVSLPSNTAEVSVPSERTGISIPSKAGDLVIFHFRINHRGTKPRAPDPIRDRKKLAIFLACSRNNSHVDVYHKFISGRAGYGYLEDFAYPADLVDQAKAAGLNLV